MVNSSFQNDYFLKQNPTSSFRVKRTLKYKILFVVLPLFLISFIFLSITAYFSINKGITNIAKEFIGYRLKEISDHANSQILPKNLNDTEKAPFILEILTYARKFSEEYFYIVPYNYSLEKTLDLSMYTINSNLSYTDLNNLKEFFLEQEKILAENPEKYNSWFSFKSSLNEHLVGIFIPNVEFQSWFILLADENNFYAPVNEGFKYFLIIIIISLILLTVLILLFVNFITKPLNYCLETIQSITNSMDFSKRVRVLYPDEIGVLGQYFNNMVRELETSYNQIKNYAYQTVIAKQKEERIRYIFQKYVPSDVIDYVLNRSNDTILIGVKQKVTILFSDIRDFTTISEKISPEELVLSLNSYFTGMVSHIINNQGMVDKFIGDAIMALFGAPAISNTSADDAVRVSLLMIEELQKFNQNQKEQDKVIFETGIGINTGDAIVGNIGSEQKVDYTVIGDPVNLSARLEGLTKSYKVPILISEFTKKELINPDLYYFINVDKVRVKGKNNAVTIYYPIFKNTLDANNIKNYEKYHQAQEYYYQGKFKTSLDLFLKLKKTLPEMYLISLYIDRCKNFIENPPEKWLGIENWKTK